MRVVAVVTYFLLGCGHLLGSRVHQAHSCCNLEKSYLMILTLMTQDLTSSCLHCFHNVELGQYLLELGLMFPQEKSGITILE